MVKIFPLGTKYYCGCGGELISKHPPGGVWFCNKCGEGLIVFQGEGYG